MIIDTHTFNDAVKIIASDKKTAVFLDANILIPPDRRSVGAKNPIKFSFYKETILDPLLNNWDNIALHESVYNELIYILHIFKLSSDEKLRVIYRYMYYATKKDKRNNPNWHDFLMKMDILYKEITT